MSAGTSYTRQAYEALTLRNTDDRCEKVGDRNRDKACAALEGMTLSRDRHVLRAVLRDMPKREFFF